MAKRIAVISKENLKMCGSMDGVVNGAWASLFMSKRELVIDKDLYEQFISVFRFRYPGYVDEMLKHLKIA